MLLHVSARLKQGLWKYAFHRLEEGSASCYRASLQTTSCKDPDPVLSTILGALIRFVCVLWGLATQLFPTLATEALLWGGPLNKFVPKRPWPPWPQTILISEAAREQNEGGLSNTVSNPVDELVHMTTEPWIFSVLAVVSLLGAESIAWLYEEAGCVVWEFNPETTSWPPLIPTRGLV